jgi:hypothetical protein
MIFCQYQNFTSNVVLENLLYNSKHLITSK